MSGRRRTETIIETHEVWIVRRRQNKSSVWCRECPGQVEMFTPEVAARLASVSPRTIYRLIEAGRLHFTETPDGMLLICQASLLTGKAAAI